MEQPVVSDDLAIVYHHEREVEPRTVYVHLHRGTRAAGSAVRVRVASRSGVG